MPLTYQYWPGPITGAGSPGDELRRVLELARGGGGLLVADAEADEEGGGDGDEEGTASTRRRRGWAPRRAGGRACALTAVWRSERMASRSGVWVCIRILSMKRAAPKVRGRRACAQQRE